MEAALTIFDLSAAFGKRVVYSGVNLTIAPGESVSVMGKSGVGKTTLLNAVLGLDNPTSGTIAIAGEQYNPRSANSRAKVRRKHIGSVFQHGELLPQLTALENVALPMLNLGNSRTDSFQAATDLLDQLEVQSTNIASNRLSGGERQRVALARALVHKPALIVADEPTGSLDQTTRDLVADLLFSVVTDTGAALLVVTHDPVIAQRAGKRVSLTAQGLVSEAVGAY